MCCVCICRHVWACMQPPYAHTHTHISTHKPLNIHTLTYLHTPQAEFLFFEAYLDPTACRGVEAVVLDCPSPLAPAASSSSASAPAAATADANDATAAGDASAPPLQSTQSRTLSHAHAHSHSHAHKSHGRPSSCVGGSWADVVSLVDGYGFSLSEGTYCR